MEPVYQVVALVVVGVALWFFLKPRYEFVVRIEAYVPRVERGKVTPAFLQDVLDACGEAGIQRGWFGGVRRGRRVVLTFSHDLPPPFRQRLRNLWALHG